MNRNIDIDTINMFRARLDLDTFWLDAISQLMWTESVIYLFMTWVYYSFMYNIFDDLGTDTAASIVHIKLSERMKTVWDCAVTLSLFNHTKTLSVIQF